VDRPSWAPPEVDIDRPSPARMYDFFLGGWHNFPVDRQMAAQVIQAVPDFWRTAQANRAFLRRAVRHLIHAGIRQFLDLGSGIPTVGNVHEVAQAAAPSARVVYVDADPVAVAHSTALLTHNPNACAVRADIRHPAAIIHHRQVIEMLDLQQPIGILMTSVLHFIPDADHPQQIIAQFQQAIHPGSFLVLSHGTSQTRPDEGAELLRLFQRTAHPLIDRNRGQILTLLSGLDLIDPGLVWAPQWRPDPTTDATEHPERTSVLAAVARR
jgi:hypothetical protein